MDNVNPLLVGIDVGTTKICALVGETDEIGGLRILGVGVEPARGMRKGVVVNVEDASTAIANAVEKAQRSAGYEIGAAFVSLAGSHIASINSRGVAGIGGSSHGIDNDDIDRALDAAQAIAIPMGAKCCTSSRAASPWTGKMASASRWACMAFGSKWRPTSSPPPPLPSRT